MSAPPKNAAAQGTDGIHRLRFGGRVDPLGVPDEPARLSWSVAADAGVDRGRGFEVRVSADDSSLDAPDVLWSAQAKRPWVEYTGPSLGSRRRCHWQVQAFATDGTRLQSPVASWETGLGEAADWSAEWITAPELPFVREGWDPCPHLRREFDAAPGAARLYVTALGLYRIWLNGTELTVDALYRPGWTDYHARVHHQTYDCTALIRPGRNVIAAVLAKGWYAGRLGLLREPGLWGRRPALRAQLEIAGQQVVTSDAQWRAGYGAIQAADLLRGEVRDERQAPQGWHDAGWDAGAWSAAAIVQPPSVVVRPQPHDSIATHQVHQGVLVHEHARGPVVYDFGQNVVGWTRLRTRTLPTVDLIVRHGEILTPEKLVYRDNLRGAFQEDSYTVGDAGPHVLEPSFTSHGFRYAEVWGLPSAEPYGSMAALPDTGIEAISVTGLGSSVGTFECSHEGLTQLASNVAWTVRDNFLEVPTDCPQRDERHGWLGDAGVIAPTAAYFFDVSAFLSKFAQDIADAQGPDGEIRNYVPAVPPANLGPGAPGWSDGYIRIVHLLAQRYGDLSTARRLLPSMTRFLDHVDRANPSGIRTDAVGADFGDWLSLPEHAGQRFHTGYTYTGAYSTTPLPVVDTAHSYRSFVQLAEIAGWLGAHDEARRLADRAEQIRQAYLATFVLADGTIKDATQTAYAQAVGFGLVSGRQAEVAVDHLCDAIERAGHLTTGIHGVQHILPVLASHGREALAADLLLREELPSWLYMVSRGATTIWEKWDGIRPDGSLSTAEMNSFNHCALGAVGQFLFERVAGIDATTAAWTGEIRVRPLYPSGLDWARATYLSPVGTIRSEWRRTGEQIEHHLEIPGCAHAVMTAPGGYRLDTTEGAAPGEQRVGSGTHTVMLRRTAAP